MESWRNSIHQLASKSISVPLPEQSGPIVYFKKSDVPFKLRLHDDDLTTPEKLRERDLNSRKIKQHSILNKKKLSKRKKRNVTTNPVTRACKRSLSAPWLFLKTNKAL